MGGAARFSRGIRAGPRPWYLEGVVDGLEMRIQETGKLAAARRFLRTPSFLRHRGGRGGGGGGGASGPADREEEGGASGEEEPTGTRDGAAAEDGFMQLGLGLLDVGVARAVKNRIKIRARKCFLSPAKRESENVVSASCSVLKLVFL